MQKSYDGETKWIKQKIFENRNSYYSDEVKDFHTRKIAEAGPNYICWSVILIGFILEKDENYYPQEFLKACKFIEKEKKSDYICS